MNYKISVDTGGTFTDVVISDEVGKEFLGKALTTPERIYLGMQDALIAAGNEIPLDIKDLLKNTNLLIYGTTRATNAIVTGNIARTAFITTKGFPDTLVLKEGGKFNPHDFSLEFPKPYIQRRDTYEISERINAEGSISIPFDEKQAREVITNIRKNKFEAIAVSFLWSITNPLHEKQMGNLIKSELPHIPYTLSHELIPVVREYRRASATAIDASLKPLMQQHLQELDNDLRTAGYKNEILISTTAGGCNHVRKLIEKPIYTIGSGPAMAPLAALYFSRYENQGENVIVCDAGGTTFDVGLVRDGRLSFSRDAWMGEQYSGHLLGISAVDVRSIGAGGGSIAWVDDGGLMRVGPHSAGANPGPACYGRGGQKPTVSDAAVVLGYFDPDFFLGGRMKLQEKEAYDAVGTIAKKINQSVSGTAWRIIRLASDLMMRAIGDISINEGFDPRESTIVAGGGAAGMNILTIAKELGCRRVILPKVASALSAAGMQRAEVVTEETASFVTTSDRFDFDGVKLMLESLELKLKNFHRELSEYSNSNISIEFIAEARYLGQVWELDTPLPKYPIAHQNDLDELTEEFHKTHERVFAVRDINSPIEIVSWRARLSINISDSTSGSNSLKKNAKVDRPTLFRECYFGSEEAISTPVYKAINLAPEIHINGPAIIEEPTTTLVLNPGMSVRVSEAGNYLMNFDE